jgi:hypothetical protein
VNSWRIKPIGAFFVGLATGRGGGDLAVPGGQTAPFNVKADGR